MEAFKTNKQLRDQVASLSASLTDAQEDNDSLTEQLNASKAEIVTKDESIATLTAKNGELEDSNKQLTADLETSQANLEASQKETKKADESTTAKAVEIAASAGHEGEVKPAEEGKQGGPTAYAKYRELQATDPRAAAIFWKENQEAIKSLK